MFKILILYTLFQTLLGQDGISTPPMGWNTWNKYNCEINEQLIKGMADTMVNKGYQEAGYTFLNIDDCWQSNDRTRDGYIIIDNHSFPNGLHTVAKYVHDKGLKFGIYSSAGRQTCAGRMASSGYERQDAETYAKIGVDYLKYDNCNYDEGISGKTRYQTMYEAIEATGKDMFISVCNWGTENTWEWANKFGHSFRSHDDIYNDWKSIVEILNVHATILDQSGPGNWADPDMLEIGNGKLTVDESKTHFSLWAAMKSPLILGNDLSDMPDDLYNIVTNKHVIKVNQDKLGQPASRIIHIPHQFDIWTGELSEQNMVIVIVNYLNQEQVFKDINIKDFGYKGSHVVGLDLWNDASPIPLYDKTIIKKLKLPAHGVAMYKFTNGTIDNYLTIEEIRSIYQISNNYNNDNRMKYQQKKSIQRYEAEDIKNTVYGLARRKGCLSCSGGAYVIAVGKVNDPQTGTLQFNNIQIKDTGHYTLTIRYLDCFSWNSCSNFWTKRWKLRIRVDNNIKKQPLMISLRSHGKVEKGGEFTVGVILKRGTHNIFLDNPYGFGPSIDYIELERKDEKTLKDDELSQHAYAYLLPFWESNDPFAAEYMWLPRLIVDYLWEWMALVMIITCLIYSGIFLHRYLIQRNRYSPILSSSSSISSINSTASIPEN